MLGAFSTAKRTEGIHCWHKRKSKYPRGREHLIPNNIGKAEWCKDLRITHHT